MGLTLGDAYATCRAIARREAKNFYYAFRVLPPHKRDAMCAVYAFMRQADDIADDETLPVETRREKMAAWLALWRHGDVEDPVYVALADTQRRFHISDALLEDLVRGTSMDLDATDGTIEVADGVRGYLSLAELYRYCYLVASVVGLVTIRIFGYSDPRAEELAEKTGLAFQITNILRDVKEDAERGRLYLPRDVLEEFSVTPGNVLELAAGREPRPNERGMVHSMSSRAWHFYAAAGDLLPMIDADSRAALWVMVKIYSGLLARIDLRNGDVFSSRVSVPTPGKLAILAQGAVRSLRDRM